MDSPRAVRRLSYRVFDGVLDPSTFQLQALTDDEDPDSWMTIFQAENEKGIGTKTRLNTTLVSPSGPKSKGITDQRTDIPTDQQTNGHTLF